MYYIIPGKAIRKLEKMALNFQEGIDFEYDSFYVQTYLEPKELQKFGHSRRELTGNYIID